MVGIRFFFSENTGGAAIAQTEPSADLIHGRHPPMIPRQAFTCRFAWLNPLVTKRKRPGDFSTGRDFGNVSGIRYQS